ncbi:NUDIX hydrolase N-terminal domain-containing protein [Stackebrandtia nassauensis]|uniref:NUDIX hydrolase n=1 Tax=Stackebrandtia nassauensis (strain DSM 44728 / CIP 108903 / NRRL B-16338 / NBRC 102104 / LLR-40K-21) TaxID=446470 RepID=D3Q7V9_STANL|nr:NUDIX hydrolase N-terminal domain-containing protein [Stackebrandtia nassauensis]ADD40464.1 NUDIX hydrolase [Stackebrandtia nassauensis DSM 44728]
MTIPTAGSRELRLAALADELRADAATGLHYTTDDADAARFHRLRGLAAALLSHVDTRDAAELEAVFAADSGPRTPLAGVVLLFNHQRDGLLFVADGDTVGVPYAFVDPDTDHDTAVKDLAAKYLPDAGLVPVPHGVCDSISAGLAMPHTYFLTYVVDLTLVDDDAIAVDLVPEADTVPGRRDALTNFILDGAQRDVLEAPFALTDEVAALVTAVRALATEGGVATENHYDVERFAHIRETTHSLLEGVRNQTAFTPVEFAHLDVATTKTCAEMLILDDRRRILLLRRHDNGKWAMPGGACEVGESSAATASRETTEEVRVDATIDGLAGVFDNSRIEDRPIQLRTCFVYVGHPTDPGAKPETTAEALEVGWFELDGLEDLPDLWEPHLVKITAALKTLVE